MIPGHIAATTLMSLAQHFLRVRDVTSCTATVNRGWWFGLCATVGVPEVCREIRILVKGGSLHILPGTRHHPLSVGWREGSP